MIGRERQDARGALIEVVGPLGVVVVECAAEIGVGEARPSEVGAFEPSTGEPRAREDCFREASVRQYCAFQVRANQSSALEHRLSEHGTPEVRPIELGAFQVRPSELRVLQLSRRKHGVSQRRAAQPGAVEERFAESRPLQTRTNEMCVVEMCVIERCAIEICLAQPRILQMGAVEVRSAKTHIAAGEQQAAKISFNEVHGLSVIRQTHCPSKGCDGGADVDGRREPTDTLGLKSRAACCGRCRWRVETHGRDSWSPGTVDTDVGAEYLCNLRAIGVRVGGDARQRIDPSDPYLCPRAANLIDRPPESLRDLALPIEFVTPSGGAPVVSKS
jgi:hypothetical protein